MPRRIQALPKFAVTRPAAAPMNRCGPAAIPSPVRERQRMNNTNQKIIVRISLVLVSVAVWNAGRFTGERAASHKPSVSAAKPLLPGTPPLRTLDTVFEEFDADTAGDEIASEAIGAFMVALMLQDSACLEAMTQAGQTNAAMIARIEEFSVTNAACLTARKRATLATQKPHELKAKIASIDRGTSRGYYSREMLAEALRSKGYLAPLPPSKKL